MLYLCHLINGRGQDILGNSKWVIKSHGMTPMACAASIFATITLAVYNMLELKELLDE